MLLTSIGFIFIIQFARVVSAVNFSPSGSCDNEETWFKSGQSYTYKYHLEVTDDVSPSNQSSNTHQLTCDVTVSSFHYCQLGLSVNNCVLGGTSQDEIEPDKSAQLSLEMFRYPVYLNYNKGEVIDHDIFIHEADPRPIRNLKRGIISLIQLKILETKEQYAVPSSVHDILGSCKTEIKLIPGDGHQMETYRDLAFCNHTGPLLYQNSWFSMAKRPRSGPSLPMITQLINPSESSVKCQYKVMADLSMEKATCVQQHLYTPMLFNGGLERNIRQSLALVSKDPLTKEEAPRDLPEYTVVDLAMEFEDSYEHDVVEDEIERCLEQLVVDISSHDIEHKFPAKRFKTFVLHLRKAQEQVIRNTKKRITAHDINNPFKFVTEEIDLSIAKELQMKSLENGLLSCGTEPCLLVLIELFKEKHITGLDSMHILFNIGLFYQPHRKVTGAIHDYCRSHTKSVSCWFALSAMLNRLEANTEEEAQQNGHLKAKVFEDLHGHIGTQCQEHSIKMDTGHKLMRHNSILNALKALGNMGRLPSEFQDKQGLASTLMDCVVNTGDDVLVSLNVVNTLSKIDLLEEISELLEGILQNDNAEMTLRVAIVDAFITLERRQQLQLLISLMETTKLDTLKTYIVTRIVSILESPDPALSRMQHMIQALLGARDIPDVKGILSKSHFAEMSHHFTIPLTPLSIGGNIGVSVVLSPSSNYFQAFSVKTSLTVSGESVDIFEITLYLQGVDSLVDFIKELKTNSSKILQSGKFLKMFHAYIGKMAKNRTPTFDQMDGNLMKRITEIFNKVNMKTASFPIAHVAVKLFGYDVAFFSSGSFLKHLKESRAYIGKKLVPTLLKTYHHFVTHASKLTDFQQTLPTVGGLPIEFDVDSTLVATADLKSDGKLEHDNGRNKEFIFDWAMVPSVSMSQDAKVVARLDGYLMMDRRHEMWINGLASLSANVKTRPQLFQKPPAFSLDITKPIGQETFTFMNAGSETFTVTNGVQTPCIHSGTTISSYEKCLPDIYTKMTGHKVCIRGSYHQALGQGHHSVLPSLATANMNGVIIPIDRELHRLTFNGNYQSTMDPHPGFRVQGNFEAKGTELSRSLFFTVERSGPNYECQTILKDPNIVFSMHSVSSRVGDSLSKRMHVSVTHNEIITQSISYLIEETVDRVPSVWKTSTMNASVTLAGGDLSVSIFRRKTALSSTMKTGYVELNYHCKPSLPMLYALHPNPDMASNSGHVSTFSLTTESETSGTSFVDTWTGSYKDVLVLPGHHISHTSQLEADLTGANRTTRITWTVGEELHDYSMFARVDNKTVPSLNEYGYNLNVVKAKDYVIDLTGYVSWTKKTGFNLSGNVDYESLRPNDKKAIKRRKRSLSSILRELRKGEQRMEEMANDAYTAAKTELWTIWKGHSGSANEITVKNNILQDQKVQHTFPLKQSVDVGREKTRSLLQLSKWDMSFNVAADLMPDIVKTPAGMKMVGMGCDWLANVTMFGGDERLFQSSGNVYKGRTFKVSGSAEDNFHETVIVVDLEHENNEELFFHHHKWHLRQGGHDFLTKPHQITQSSSEVRVRLQHDVFPHNPQFLLGVNTTNSIANITYHLNYTKTADKKHQIRAHGLVTSNPLPFHLKYRESTDITDKTLQSKFEMNSTFLDYNLTLIKSVTRRGLNMGGTLKYNFKLPFYKKDSKVGVYVALAPRRPPVGRIVYHPVTEQDGVQTTITLRGSKRLEITVSTQPYSSSANQETKTLLTWTLALSKPRVLQHTVNISTFGANVIQGWIRGIHGINQTQITDMAEQDVHESMQNRLNMTRAQSLQSTKEKVLKLLMRGVETVSNVWEKSVPVTIYHTLHLNEGIDTVTKFAARLATEMAHQPPFIVRQFTKLYIDPQLKRILEGRQVIMIMSLPFVWESFKQMPQGTMTDRELKEEMMLSKVIPPYRDMALLMGGNWARTFDGHWIDLGGRACTYLMAADFKRKSFAIMYSKADGMRALSNQSGIVLKSDGTFLMTGGQSVSSLPYTTPDKSMKITFNHGKLTVLLSHGAARLTFDTELNLYFFEAGHQLNNASLGMWGTNNQEPGDDFRLPDGTISESSGTMLNRYELNQCQDSTVSNTSSSTCTSDNEANSLCQSFFHGNTNLALCVLQINPRQFKNLCKTRECLSESGCPVIQAYEEACRRKGLNVRSTPQCEECQMSIGHPTRTDIVFVQSLHRDMVGEIGVLDTAIGIANSLTNSDVMIGFVTYAGQGPYQEPMAHLIKQRAFSPVNDYLTTTPPVRRPATRSTPTSPEKAIELATHFPFREGSIRLVILIHTTQEEEAFAEESKLVNALRMKTVHFLSATSRPHYNSRRIVGKIFDEVVDEQEVSKSGIDVLVKKTRGAWISTDLLSTTDTNFLQTYQERISTKNINACHLEV